MKKRVIVVFLFALPSVILILLVCYRVATHSQHASAISKATFSVKEKDFKNFQVETKNQWGQQFVDASNSNAVWAVATSQPIFNGNNPKVELSKIQLEALYSTITEFINTYNDGTLPTILKFHSRSPFVINYSAFDNEYFRTELNRDGIEIPSSSERRLEAYWTLLQHYKFRTDFWLRFKEAQLKQGKTPDPNSATAFQEYRQDLKEHESSYVPLKLVAVSSNLFEISIFAQKQTTNLVSEMTKLNRRRYPGVQTVEKTIFIHEDSPEKNIAQRGECVFAVVETAFQVNVTDSFVPVSLVLHWSPENQTWLPDLFAKHAHGSFQFLF